MTDALTHVTSALADRYRIDREIGAGGMATVYLAHDIKHDREVAIKVLKPKLGAVLGAERFLAEIKVTANLQHPNLLPLFDSGAVTTSAEASIGHQPSIIDHRSSSLLYYVMPYVSGETLRARLDRERQLPVDETVRLVSLIAGALDYAHARGVVHRDLKPENILLQAGQPIVADFGIALAVAQAGGERITQTGLSLGTPHYMSPEQAAGEHSVDARSDHYSLGALTYEMLTGEPPHSGATAQVMIARLMTEAPRSTRAARPLIPQSLDDAVLRALAKSPADRFASCSEFASAAATVAAVMPVIPARTQARKFVLAVAGLLIVAVVVAYWATGRGSADVVATSDKSLAVLPFTATRGDTSNSYLAEGIADQVTNNLALVPGLRLAGRTSSARFGGKGATAQEVGKALGVAAVLDGTVRRAGNQIRVTVELSNAADGRVLWHENYERPAADLFSVQDDIARAIAAALQVTLVGAGAAAVRGTDDLVAYDLYLRGLYLFRRRGPGLATGSSSFEQAIARDSNFAKAWAGLASTLMVMPYFLDIPMRDVLPRARAAAERAVRLDSTLAEAHLSLGFVLGESFEFEAAEREIRRAIALETASAEPLYRLCWLLLNTGRSAEAIPVLQQAKARDPLYFVVSSYLGWAQIDQGQLDEGIAEQRRAADLEPQNLAALSILTRGYQRVGMPDSAKALARRLVGLTRSPIRLGAAAFVLARSGERGEANALIRQMEPLPPDAWTKWAGLAIGYTGIRDFERAIAAMQETVKDDGDLFVPFATVIAGELPDDPRIDAVWRRYNLDPARFATRRGVQRP